MPADMGGKSPLRDGRNEESILAEIKQISSLLQFKTCAPALLITLLVISDRSELYELGIRPCGKRVPNMLNDPIVTYGAWSWLSHRCLYSTGHGVMTWLTSC